MRTHLLALDQGTTSSRALLLDRDGNVAAVAQREFEQIFPQAGWVEHNPVEIWSTQAGVVAEVISSSGIRAQDISAISTAGPRKPAPWRLWSPGP
jgi:glycerol kinase